MDPLLLIVVILLLCGGGFGYYGYRSKQGVGYYGSGLGSLVVIILILYLVGVR